VLYAFLYTTLQLQDFSLLFGSVGIFAVIAVIMYVSRKVNWYRESDPTGQES
jgi:inner membrane protein